MSKQDAMKIQACALRVNIHCDGCKKKVKKTLQKIDGVYNMKIDAEQGKVIVTGNVDPAELIKKLEKSGKHAELWGAQLSSNNNMNKFKNNMQFQNVKGGSKEHNNNMNMNMNMNKFQMEKAFLQQQQQLKGSNNNNKGGNINNNMHNLMAPPPRDKKSVKFNLPEDDSDFSGDEFGDEFDDEFDDDDDDDDEFDDEHDEFSHGHGHGLQKNAPIPMMGTFGSNRTINFNAMNGKKSGDVGRAKKDEVIDFPVMMKDKGGGKEGKNSSSGGGGTKSKSKGGDKKKGGKRGGGFLGLGKKGLFGFGGKSSSKKENGNKSKGSKSSNKSVESGGGKHNGNGPKKGGKTVGLPEFDKLDIGFHDIDIPKPSKGGKGSGGNGKNMSQMGQIGHVNNGNRGHPRPMAPMAPMGPVGPMGPMGPMGPGGINMSQMRAPMGNYAMSQMGNIPAVQGLPAQQVMNGGGVGGGGGYYQGMGQGNPYNPQQQQYMAMMMNQQRGVGNEMFQPMMYSRPNPAMNYAPPPLMFPPVATDQYTHAFSDENTDSCSIM